MSSISDHHRTLTDGVGKCSKPMWSGYGTPAGFCDKPAYGPQGDGPKAFRRDDSSGKMIRLYVPALACPEHGGPEKGAPF